MECRNCHVEEPCECLAGKSELGIPHLFIMDKDGCLFAVGEDKDTQVIPLDASRNMRFRDIVQNEECATRLEDAIWGAIERKEINQYDDRIIFADGTHLHALMLVAPDTDKTAAIYVFVLSKSLSKVLLFPAMSQEPRAKERSSIRSE